MELPEISWRVKQFVQTRLEAAGIGRAKYRAPVERGYGQAWLAELPVEFEQSIYINAAERVLSGRFNVFAMPATMLGFPPHWNRDPKTGTHAPAAVVGTTLNYRNEKLVGDIKYLWEFNRHLELVTLAQAYRLTGKTKYSEGVYTLLNSWMDQCPYPLGPNWTSSLELAVRIVNWSFAWHLLGGASSPLFKGNKGRDFKLRWLRSIYEHCFFIYTHLSRYSSANNHLFGEYMGLFIASVTWPLWKECDIWRDASQVGLEMEAKKQISPDGVNREQAIWYHHEVADMMLLCGLVGKANSIEFSPDFWRRLESMMEFIDSLMDVDGNLPMIGDSDDAVMVRFSPVEDFHVYRSLLATCAVLFKRSRFKVKAKVFDDKSMWLLGEDAKKVFDGIQDDKKNLPELRAMSEGGYYILGNHFETNEEVRIIADAGPLGYLSIAAHGHADALSVNLSVGGNEFLIDPGTFAYHTQKKWRNYFRGTSAHNTVRVDGQDQSVIGGNFLWLAKASSICEQWKSDSREDFFCGSHDGYTRLNDPLIHRRSVRFLKNENRIEITDNFVCQGEHVVERFWHFSEQCKVYEDQNSLVAENNGLRLKLETSDKTKVKVFRADEHRPLGWISRKFDEKIPTTTALYINKINGAKEMMTTIIL